MTALVVALCAIGLWAAASMQVKSIRAARGDLTEPSVVQTPRARLLAGAPNSLFGIFFYLALAAAAFALDRPAVYWTALIATALAAATSAFLAYSLLFVTRMPCVRCWTAHAVNWALFVLLVFGRP